MVKIPVTQWIAKKIRKCIGIVEDTDTAENSISAGKFVIWKGNSYTADSAITAGDTLADSGAGKNLTEVSDGIGNALNSKIEHVRPVPSYSEQTIFASTEYTSTISASGTIQHTGSLYYHFWARKGRVSLSINGAESALLENVISATDSISIGGTIAVKEGDTYVLNGVPNASNGTEYAQVILRY